jgi:hypothetical protein
MVSESSLHTRLEKEIEGRIPGEILFPTDFLELGSSTAILMTLSRLEDQGILKRLAKGIYVKPEANPDFGPILPSLDAIAQAIAAKEQVIIRPTGAYALNKLGLSTQVPTKVVYLTNGSRRHIKVGRGFITFKPTTPKKLAAKNELVFLAIQSLIALGPTSIRDPKVLQILIDKLKQVPVPVIREDARHAPQFVSTCLLQIAHQLDTNDRIFKPE